MARGLFTLAVALLVGAVVSFAMAEPTVRTGTAPAGPGSSPIVTQDGAPSDTKRLRPPPPRQPALPAKPPSAAAKPAKSAPDAESIRVPALGIDQDLVELAVVGTKLQVPDDYSDVGWWSGGPIPGENGAAVMVGHVDSPTGPAVFYHLSGLRAGHQIVLKHENGSRTVFAVRKVRVFDRSEFPSARVYRSQGRPALHLVTCGGSFDAGTEQYTSNVVVFADLVDRRPALDRESRRQHEKPTRNDKDGSK